MAVFQFTVSVLDAESFTDAVAQMKDWRGGELNDDDRIATSLPVMLTDGPMFSEDEGDDGE